MRKIAFSTVFLLASLSSQAQELNIIYVFSDILMYKDSGNASFLEDGIYCSDEMVLNKNTVNKSRTWLYRGELFTLVSMDTTLRKKYPDATFEAIKAFEKLYALRDTGFRSWDDAFGYMNDLGPITFNSGVYLFYDSNYTAAFRCFYSLKGLVSIFIGKGKKPNLEISLVLRNSAWCAEKAGDITGAARVYKELIELAPNVSAYRDYILILRKLRNFREANRVLDAALTKYPGNSDLLMEKINAGAYPKK